MRRSGHAGRELTVVVPTFNERENVHELIRRLDAVLAGRSWEIVFVDDDSTDGTTDAVLSAARTDPRVRLIHRIGRRGLSTAVVEGILSSATPIVAVMDADLQHDEQMLPAMLDRFERTDVDVVVGSRYVAGGGVGDWSNRRQTVSRVATRLSRFIVPADLTDPMSGFFVIRREAFDRSVRALSGQGYKILLDILASAPVPLRVAETPYTFRSRLHGESKLDSAVLWDFGMLLIDKLIGHRIPPRFLLFTFVGGLGTLVHFATLSVVFRALGANFAFAQGTAAVAAMTCNFFLNNVLTYRDRRLRGAVRLARGLLTFYAVCFVGLVANIGIANVLFRQAYSWWLAGLAGIAVGAVWNYAASAIFTWDDGAA